MATPQEQRKKKIEEILETAATWEEGKVGRHRLEDGTLPDWSEWSQRQPQRDNPVQLCEGRRGWVEAKSDANEKEVSIISWNILSDSHYRASLPENEYSHTPLEQGEWSFRFSLMKEAWWNELQPDILCLQEVDFVKFEEDIKPALQRIGYDGLLQKQTKKSKSSSYEQPCGCATFWKTSRFELVEMQSRSRTITVLLSEVTQQQQEEDDETGDNNEKKTGNSNYFALPMFI